MAVEAPARLVCVDCGTPVAGQVAYKVKGTALAAGVRCEVCHELALDVDMRSSSARSSSATSMVKRPRDSGPTDARVRFAAGLEAELERTPHLQKAAALVLEQLLEEGYGDALWRLVGASPLVSQWKRARTREKTTRQPGERRVAVAQLRRPVALLESLYPINGTLVPLGDFLRDHCRVLAAEYRRQAAQQQRGARFLDAVGARLDGQRRRVRDCWTEPELRALLEGLQP